MSGRRLPATLSRLMDRRAAFGLAGGIAAAARFRPARAEQDETCSCEQVGVTGGGVVRTGSGDASLVIFASRLVNSERPPTGVVRWRDPNFEGGLRLENDGAIVYAPVEGEPLSREVSGWASINGDRIEPFRLLLTAGDPDAGTPGRCRLDAGDTLGGAASGWGYSAGGDLVGGDLVLLGERPVVA